MIALWTSGMNHKGGYRGYPLDVQKALLYIRKAAELGNANAQFEYAVMLINGEGTSRDEKGFVKCIKESAENGNEDAKYRWAAVRYLGQFGVKCLDYREFGECRSIIEKAATDNENAKDLVEELHMEENRLGRSIAMKDVYG